MLQSPRAVKTERMKGTANSFCMTCKLSLGSEPTEIHANQRQAHQIGSALRLQLERGSTVMLFIHKLSRSTASELGIIELSLWKRCNT